MGLCISGALVEEGWGWWDFKFLEEAMMESDPLFICILICRKSEAKCQLNSGLLRKIQAIQAAGHLVTLVFGFMIKVLTAETPLLINSQFKLKE